MSDPQNRDQANRAATILERKQQARGLAWMAAAAIVFALCRAGFGKTFVHRWWWPF